MSGLATAIATGDRTPARVTDAGATMNALRELGLRSLVPMYSRADGLFHFRVRRTAGGVQPEGLSHRYTAIAVIGLATQSADIAEPICGSLQDLCRRIVKLAETSGNLGDVALTCWAAHAAGFNDAEPAWKRLIELQPATAVHPTVEMAWALAAMSIDAHRVPPALRDKVAERLMLGLNRAAGVNRHVLGSNTRHVACFADQVYPIHALALYSALTGNKEALHDAARCAHMITGLQGPAGQWWWHYDVRTGSVVEGYPVYAIHQDAMAPMALFALRNSGGPDFIESINRGVRWMDAAPELQGGSVVDRAAGFIWRKVARREPSKLTRYMQAAASKVHPAVRVPGTDLLFPPCTIDYEDRPYHIGWMLYAMALSGKSWSD